METSKPSIDFFVIISEDCLPQSMEGKDSKRYLGKKLRSLCPAAPMVPLAGQMFKVCLPQNSSVSFFTVPPICFSASKLLTISKPVTIRQDSLLPVMVSCYMLLTNMPIHEFEVAPCSFCSPLAAPLLGSKSQSLRMEQSLMGYLVHQPP